VTIIILLSYTIIYSTLHLFKKEDKNELKSEHKLVQLLDRVTIKNRETH